MWGFDTPLLVNPEQYQTGEELMCGFTLNFLRKYMCDSEITSYNGWIYFHTLCSHTKKQIL